MTRAPVVRDIALLTIVKLVVILLAYALFFAPGFHAPPDAISRITGTGPVMPQER